MNTYRPEEHGINQTSSQYNQGGTYGYNNTQYNQGGTNGYNPQYGANGYNPQYGVNGYNPQYGTNGQFDYTSNGNGMDMSAGFESGNPVQMSGIKNLGAIISNEVIAKSYLFMMVALFITAGAALTTSPAVAIRIITGNGYITFILAELAIVWGADFAIAKNKPILAGILFAAYSYMTGMLFSIFFVLYTGGSLAAVFLMCSGMFAFMAIYGMVTDRDLSSVGNICLMGLVGIIIATCVNLIFLRSSMFDFIVSIVGVLIFVGLTAYDANKTKRIAATSDSNNALAMSMFCALELYLDFINLFLKLLSLFGKRK
ncbi:MAG: Bax inhibitor-1/YccA family protein [Lachnospiraceae bacterium]|nr:Bax inhibitor-1/YccA family protein [Lachnospiraceae bacterium]